MSADVFSGFGADALEFLRDLAAHNDKAWFEHNRDRYERSLLEPAKAFVAALAHPLHRLEPDLVIDPRVNGSIFRINRDVRFSKDKRPYKEELGFRFPAAGAKGVVSGLYLRIRPDLVGLAAGIWSFDPAALARHRRAVDDARSGGSLARLLEGFEVNGCRFLAESYKRVPAPWPQDHPRGDLLRLKGLMAGQDIDVPKALHRADFVGWCAERFEGLLPLHRWLTRHVVHR